MSKNLRQRALVGFEDMEEAKKPPVGADHTSSSVNKKAADQTNPDLPLAGKSVWVVDAHSLIYQVFHAMPEMSSPAGQPVGAVHGFIRDIVELLDKKQPDYLFCAFDHPGDTYRHDLYDQYKIQRESMPDDLRPQIGSIQRMLEGLAVPVLSVPRYEADDIMATLAVQTEKLGGRCYLVTGDKDCRQLISDNVFMFNIRKNQVIDAAFVIEDWGVRPDQVVDFQALWGDSVDNVPGIEGIGKKTARELLEKYGTLEGVLDHAEEVTAKRRRENLMSGRDKAMLSRELVRLNTDSPVTVDWEAGRIGGYDEELIEQLCREFGFRRLADRLAALTIKEPAADWNANYRTIATIEDLDWLVGQLSQQERFSFDTETTSTNPRWAELVGYSFAWKRGEAYYVPVRAPAGEPRLDPDVVLEKLRPVLENSEIEKVGQNLKYDMIVLRGAGVNLRGQLFDTLVADYLLDPGERNHSMDDLAKRYLSHATIKISELIGTGKKQKQMDEVPVDEVTQYAAEDADVPWRLSAILEKRLKREKLLDLFHDLETPLIEVLAELEFNGVKVDVNLLRRLSDQYGQRLKELEREIYQTAGCEFNIDSRQQLAKVLFEDLGLPVQKRTKTGPSTDVEVLVELAKLHELPAKIIDYRQNAKLKSTYVDALPELVHPTTGRVHTSFRQDVAATGRLSSTDPNLQNIPIRTSAGREIREAFVPGDEGWSLLTADYSQIELRVLAHFSADANMLKAFHDDQDIHARVASEVYGVPPDEVTSDMRRSAKAINFGIIYGQTPFGLAKALEIEKDDAAAFIDAYFERYPGVSEFMTKVLDECRENGYVSTALGRRRAVHGVRSSSSRGDSHHRTLPERIAINTVIQGSAADLIKLAMINLHRRMQREKLQARMLLQIHDELVFESPPHELSLLSKMVPDEMSAVGQLSVDLKVDVKVGANWAQCEPL